MFFTVLMIISFACVCVCVFKVASEFIKSIKGKKPKNFRVIVSSHNYQNTPSLEDLSDLSVRIQQAGADIVKIVTTSVDITDVARMFHITSNAQVSCLALHVCCWSLNVILMFELLHSNFRFPQ